MKSPSTNYNKAVLPLVVGAVIVLLQQAKVVSEYVAANFGNANLVWDSVLVLAMTAAVALAPKNKGDRR